MSVRRYEELITGRAGDFHFYLGGSSPPPCLALLNVKYLVMAGPVNADPSQQRSIYYGGELFLYRGADTPVRGKNSGRPAGGRPLIRYP